MGRPPTDLDEYLDWQERLDRFKASGLEIAVFCLKEGVSDDSNFLPQDLAVHPAKKFVDTRW